MPASRGSLQVSTKALPTTTAHFGLAGCIVTIAFENAACAPPLCATMREYQMQPSGAVVCGWHRQHSSPLFRLASTMLYTPRQPGLGSEHTGDEESDPASSKVQSKTSSKDEQRALGGGAKESAGSLG
uniref:Uncharacterized protein n=1 Tax=Rhizochromulina marina TaxID=1034831 RepID=A0A7S2SK95_9STRA